jgi:hypothetical protein
MRRIGMCMSVNAAAYDLAMLGHRVCSKPVRGARATTVSTEPGATGARRVPRVLLPLRGGTPGRRHRA